MLKKTAILVKRGISNDFSRCEREMTCSLFFLEKAVFILYYFWPSQSLQVCKRLFDNRCLEGGESWPSRSGGAEGGPHQAAERVQDPSEGKAEVSTRTKCFFYSIFYANPMARRLSGSWGRSSSATERRWWWHSQVNWCLHAHQDKRIQVLGDV